MVSMKMRSRVTSGALWYSSSTLMKRSASTLGLGDHLIAIALRRLQDALGLAARLGNHPIGVGLRFVLQALLIGAGRLHVAEGVDDLCGRIDLLQLHLDDADAGAIAVQDASE